MSDTLYIGKLRFDVGEYRRYKNKIQFYNKQKEPWFALVRNKFGERFFVETSKTPLGKIWYSCTTLTDTDKAIGLSYGMKQSLAYELWQERAK